MPAPSCSSCPGQSKYQTKPVGQHVVRDNTCQGRRGDVSCPRLESCMQCSCSSANRRRRTKHDHFGLPAPTLCKASPRRAQRANFGSICDGRRQPLTFVRALVSIKDEEVHRYRRCVTYLTVGAPIPYVSLVTAVAAMRHACDMAVDHLTELNARELQQRQPSYRGRLDLSILRSGIACRVCSMHTLFAYRMSYIPLLYHIDKG